MKKKERRHDQINLSGRLVSIMMIYLDGLGPKKKAKMKKYLDEKMDLIVDHYIMLLKKKNLKLTVPYLSDVQVDNLLAVSSRANETDFVIANNDHSLIIDTEKELIE